MIRGIEDAVMPGKLGALIDIDAHDLGQSAHGIAQFAQFRVQHSAGAAPLGAKFHDDQIWLRDDCLSKPGIVWGRRVLWPREDQIPKVGQPGEDNHIEFRGDV